MPKSPNPQSSNLKPQTSNLTASLLADWFTRFNAAYFGGTLPRPALKVSHARGRLGYLSFRRRRPGWHIAADDYCIHISDYFVRSERDYQNVMLHEMIHYYIAWHRLPDTSSHGPRFRAMMTLLNEKYGWNITVSTSDHGLKPRVEKPRRPHLVLVMRLIRSRQGLIAVNPRYFKQIDHALRHSPTVVNFAWYSSTDPFFDHLPAVRTLGRIRLMSCSELDSWTSRMTPITPSL